MSTFTGYLPIPPGSTEQDVANAIRTFDIPLYDTAEESYAVDKLIGDNNNGVVKITIERMEKPQ